MQNLNEIVNDLQATTSYVRGEVTEHADDFGFEEAVALVDELERIKRTVVEAIGMLDARKLQLLEGGSRQVGDRVFASIPDGKTRFDHSMIKANVIEQSVLHAAKNRADDGLKTIAQLAAETAVDRMLDIYVSPSTQAKVGGLDRVGVKKKEVANFEASGRKIQVVDLKLKQDEDGD
jgi:hypothetical protein